MLKDFDNWNKKKQQLDKNKDAKAYCKIGDVWVASVGQNIGYEQNGKGKDFLRPILIVKKFNNQMVWAVPLTSIPKSLNFYYNFTDPHENNVAAILAQLKLFSTKRLYRKVYRIQEEKFYTVINELKKLLSE